MIEKIRQHRIGVLCGGYSHEREVSLRSGENVYQALLRLGYQAFKIDPLHDDMMSVDMDIAFNMLHGFYGEDGGVQSILEMRDIPYTGSGVQASILAMNKLLTKGIMNAHSIPTAPYQIVMPQDLDKGLTLTYPVIIKPLNQGSSVGVKIVDHPDDFKKIALLVMSDFDVLLVEEYFKGIEVTVGILEREGVPEALPMLELRSKNRFYDYEAKYTPGMTEFIIPATVSDAIQEVAADYAIQLHNLVGCRGMSRVDMIVTKTGPIILEINTVPGMTTLSDLPAQAQSMGMTYDELVEAILRAAC